METNYFYRYLRIRDVKDTLRSFKELFIFDYNTLEFLKMLSIVQQWKEVSKETLIISSFIAIV